MRVGVIVLPERRWARARADWQVLDREGFDSAWTLDHFSWRSFSDGPWFSALPLLGAVATVTDRIRIGTLVASPNFRHPALLAKEAVVLDDLSGGRFTLGLGSGSVGAGDTNVIDRRVLSTRQRGDRFAEFVDVVDQLLRGTSDSYDGEYYSVTNARMHPGCLRRPRLPLAVAAAGPRGAAVAAQHADAWVSCGPVDLAAPTNSEQFLRAVSLQSQTLDRACWHAGRDPRSIDRVVVSDGRSGDLFASVDAFVENAESFGAVGITDFVVHWQRDDEGRPRDADVLCEIAGALPHLRDLAPASAVR